jgi:fatty-acyl-CoA synthase
MNIGNWLKSWSESAPEKVVLIFEGETLTYKDLNLRVNALANSMLAWGVERGDRVGTILRNCTEFLEIYFAAARIGAIFVPLNMRLALPELNRIISDSKIKLLFLHNETVEDPEMTLSELGISKENGIIVGYECPAGLMRYEEFHGGYTNQDEPSIPWSIDEEDPQMIMYTSGTSGLPKGVMLPHRKTFYNSLNAHLFFDLTFDDIMLIALPLYHSGGLLIGATPILYCGGTILLFNHFQPKLVLEAIQDFRVTKFLGVTTVYNFLLQEGLEKYDISSLKTCVVGGERVSPSLLQAYKRHGIILKSLFGQTETSVLIAHHGKVPPDKLNATGRPVFHGEVKVVDENGRPVRPNQIGEIVARGPILMLGYWKNPGLTEETIRDGWLHTGDLARIDEDGYVYIVDRKKEMYISGGLNVYPAEVENLYTSHPKILEAAIIGVPDEKWGEVGKAFIVLKEGETMTEEEALGFPIGKLAKYKIPRHIVFLHELPKSGSNKVQKYLLHEY